MLKKPNPTEFNVYRASRYYLVTETHKDIPKDPREQIRLLKLSGQDNLQTARNSGVALDTLLENNSLLEKHKKQLYENAKRVFYDSRKYTNSLSEQQKNKIPEYHIDKARIINEKLDRVKAFLASPENIDLVEKIVNSPYVGADPRQRQRHIIEEYNSRAHSLNIDGLDTYELELFSKTIKNTALKVYNKQNLEHQEALKRCRAIEDEISEILYKTADMQERAREIQKLEVEFGLEEFGERILIQMESFPERSIPPALKNANRVLNLIDMLKNGVIARKSPTQEKVPF